MRLIVGKVSIKIELGFSKIIEWDTEWVNDAKLTVKDLEKVLQYLGLKTYVKLLYSFSLPHWRKRAILHLRAIGFSADVSQMHLLPKTIGMQKRVNEASLRVDRKPFRATLLPDAQQPHRTSSR